MTLSQNELPKGGYEARTPYYKYDAANKIIENGKVFLPNITSLKF